MILEKEKADKDTVIDDILDQFKHCLSKFPGIL